MWIAETVAQMRQHRARLAGIVGFVPTMGALHAGHLSLIEQAARLADHVIVSIFVNPTQFGPNEDFDRYPRPIQQDLELCRQAGVHGVFHPSIAEMYPPGQIACDLDVPQLTSDLEGKFRPGHFRGVCRVVAKLFNIVQPHLACFGKKDYQQLLVVQAMTADLALPIRIVPCETVREPDGLAMSSRNSYLSPDQRRQATGIYKALCQARHMVEVLGETDPRKVEQAMHQVLLSHGFAVDYAVVRHPHTLAELDSINPQLTGPVVALIAARLGQVRLIDNMLLGTRS